MAERASPPWGAFLDSPTVRVALTCGLTALALGLRLYRLGHEPLWFDEAYTAITAKKSLGEILVLLRRETSAPLYYVLLHGWEGLVGDGDARLRLLSAVTGAAVVPLLSLVGTRMFSPTAGAIAAAFAAVGPLHVHFSQELRMYALVPVVALGVLYGFARLARAPDAVGVALLAGALIAGLYLHYFTAFLVPLAACALLSAQRPRAIVATTVALALAGLAFAPWLATLVGQVGSTEATYWIANFWKSRSLWIAVPWSLVVLGPGGFYPPLWFKLQSSSAAGAVSLLVALVIVGAAVVHVAKTRGDARMPWLLTVGAVLVPLVIAVVVSVVRAPIYVVGRYDMIAWTPYLLLAGAVLARWRLAFALPVIALWIGLSFATLVPHYTTDRPLRVPADRGPWLADLIAKRATPDDLVLFTASTRTTPEHYLGGAAERLRMVSYPLGTDDHLGWIDLRIASDEAFAQDAARRMAEWITRLDAPPRQIWLVAPFAAGNRPLFEALGGLGYAFDQAALDRNLMLFTQRAR